MNTKLSLRLPSHSALACALGLIALAGCTRGGTAAQNTTGDSVATTAPPLDALPLTTADTGPSAPAPVGAALPPAPRARIARLSRPGDQYAYLERAYAESRAFADAPPDYAYDYDGSRPWVWRGNDGSVRLAERLPTGLRYYYYQPGAEEPYLVQDPDASYAYSDGQLVTVYGRDGAVLPYDDYEDRADLAGRYLARASALYAASVHQQRYAVEQARWDAQRANVAAEREQWAAEQSQYGAWQAYHQAHDEEEQAHWAADRYQREAEAARYDQQVNDQAGAALAIQAALNARQVAQRYGQLQNLPSGGGRFQPGQGGAPPRAGLTAPGFAAPQPRPGFLAGGPGPAPQSNPSGPTQQEGALQARQQAMAQQRALGQAAAQQAAMARAQAGAQQQAARQAAALAHQQAIAQAAASQAAANQAAASQAAARAHAQAAAQQQAVLQARRQAQAQQAAAEATTRQAAAAAHAQVAAQQQAAREAAMQAHQQAAARQAAGEAAARQAAAQAHVQALAQQQAARQAALSSAHAQPHEAPPASHPPANHPPETGRPHDADHDRRPDQH